MRDLRQFARQTNFRLIAGGISLLFVVGLPLIYILWGEGAAIVGLICLLAGLAPLGLIWLALYVMERIVQRANQDR